jgi:hypothetical protein
MEKREIQSEFWWEDILQSSCLLLGGEVQEADMKLKALITVT